MYHHIQSFSNVFKAYMCTAIICIFTFCKTDAIICYTNDILILVIALGLDVWFQFYLSGQRIELYSDKIIKHSGRILRRRTVFFINNISWLQTVSFGGGLPAFMKIIYPGGNVHLIGFTGRQLAAVERAVLRTSK